MSGGSERAVSLPEEEREERHKHACVLESHHMHNIYTRMYIMADIKICLTSVQLKLIFYLFLFMYFFVENNINYMHFIVLLAI